MQLSSEVSRLSIRPWRSHTESFNDPYKPPRGLWADVLQGDRGQLPSLSAQPVTIPKMNWVLLALTSPESGTLQVPL